MSGASTARKGMIGRTRKEAVGRNSLEFRSDDLSGDYYSMIESEIIKVNPSLPTTQVRSMANRIASHLERIIAEERALLGA